VTTRAHLRSSVGRWTTTSRADHPTRCQSSAEPRTASTGPASERVEPRAPHAPVTTSASRRPIPSTALSVASDAAPHLVTTSSRRHVLHEALDIHEHGLDLAKREGWIQSQSRAEHARAVGACCGVAVPLAEPAWRTTRHHRGPVRVITTVPRVGAGQLPRPVIDDRARVVDDSAAEGLVQAPRSKVDESSTSNCARPTNTTGRSRSR
jgi:hypothetical protein